MKAKALVGPVNHFQSSRTFTRSNLCLKLYKGPGESGSGFTQGMVWRAEPGGVATVGIFPDKFLAFLLGSLRCQMVDWGAQGHVGNSYY